MGKNVNKQREFNGKAVRVMARGMAERCARGTCSGPLL